MDDLHHRIHFLFRRVFLKSRWDSIFEHLPVENGTGRLYAEGGFGGGAFRPTAPPNCRYASIDLGPRRGEIFPGG